MQRYLVSFFLKNSLGTSALSFQPIAMNFSPRLPGIEHIALSHRAPKGDAQRETDHEKVKRSNEEGHGESINSDLVNPWYLQFYLYGNICLKIFYICMQLCILFLMGNSMNNTSVQKK